jgi:hypothetical protein
MRRAAVLVFACAGALRCSDAGSIPLGGDGGSAEAAAEASAVTYDVSGTIVDGSNVGWAGAMIQVCNEALCTLGNTDTTGAFRVSVPPGAGYHVIARPGPSDTREASAGLGIVGNVAADVALAPIAIPVMGPKVELAGDAGPQSVAVTSDLTLTASVAGIDFEADAYLAGASVPSASWPAFAIPGKTILAMWALDPWGTRANVGQTIGVAISNVFGLAPGATVSVYAVSELTAELGTASAGVVSTDGTSITGSTVDRVTWVVLATP